MRALVVVTPPDTRNIVSKLLGAKFDENAVHVGEINVEDGLVEKLLQSNLVISYRRFHIQHHEEVLVVHLRWRSISLREAHQAYAFWGTNKISVHPKSHVKRLLVELPQSAQQYLTEH